MKKIAIILLVMISGLAAQAQKLVIGAKMPDMKGVQWISGNLQSPKSVYIDFYQSTNATCKANLEKIKALKVQYPHMKVVLLTRENNETIAELAKELGEGFFVGYDSDGKKYEAFGVKFVPFSMVFDAKGNLLWQGNASQLKPEHIKGL